MEAFDEQVGWAIWTLCKWCAWALVAMSFAFAAGVIVAHAMRW